MNHIFMPKQSTISKSKSKAKAKSSSKRKVQPETPGITTQKWYWIMLTIVMVAVFSVASYLMGLNLSNIVVLMFTIVFLCSLMGYVGVTPSVLSKSKRATFLFAGASVIGFSIWAVIMLISMAVGLIDNLFSDSFLIIPSLILCLIAGSFIGEFLGKNKRVQTFFFKPGDIS